MIALIPGAHPEGYRPAVIAAAGRPAPEALRLLPAPYGSERSSQRWHAGEARFAHVQVIARGAIMPIGGEEVLATGSPILNAFVDLAGGRNARIMLLPASGDPRDAEPYRRLLARRAALVDIGVMTGAEDVQHSDLATRLDQMTGLFIIGGTDVGIQHRLVGTRLAEAIRDANERGLVVASCGAGASLLGRHLVPSDSGDSPSTGLGLLDDVIIDRHAAAPGRIEQLLAAFADRPNQIAFCLKQQSALIVTPDRQARVIGERSVMVIDGRPTAADPRDAANGGVPTVTGARIHLLAPGRVFDLDRGRVNERQSGPIGRPVG